MTIIEPRLTRWVRCLVTGSLSATVIDTIWEPEISRPLTQIPLVVSLILSGESRTYARRQGASPIKVEQQITELALDQGAKWIVRVQNDSQTKVSGRVRVNYTPSL
jgi:hypothetical protein